MRKFFNIAFIAIGLLMVNNISAQKIGYVDSQAIIQLMPDVKEANSNIETFKKQLEKKGKEMIKVFQANYQALEKRQTQGEISPKVLEAEAQKLKNEENAIMLFEQESQQKVLSKSDVLLKPIRDRIQKAIEDVAAENEYVYVFDYSTGFLLYADAAVNLNEKVKQKLGL